MANGLPDLWGNPRSCASARANRADMSGGGFKQGVLECIGHGVDVLVVDGLREFFHFGREVRPINSLAFPSGGTPENALMMLYRVADGNCDREVVGTSNGLSCLPCESILPGASADRYIRGTFAL